MCVFTRVEIHWWAVVVRCKSACKMSYSQTFNSKYNNFIRFVHFNISHTPCIVLCVYSESSRVYMYFVGRKWILRWRGDLVWLSLTALLWLSVSSFLSIFFIHSITRSIFVSIFRLRACDCGGRLGLKTGRNFPLTVKIFKWKRRGRKIETIFDRTFSKSLSVKWS